MAAVLVVGDITNPVQPVLDAPVPACEVAEAGGVSALRGQAGDAVGVLERAAGAVEVSDVAGDQERLREVGEVQPVDVGVDLDRAPFDAAVTAISFGVRGETSRTPVVRARRAGSAGCP